MLTEVSLNLELVTSFFTFFLVSKLLLEARNSFGGSDRVTGKRGGFFSSAMGKRSLLDQRVGKRIATV